MPRPSVRSASGRLSLWVGAVLSLGLFGVLPTASAQGQASDDPFAGVEVMEVVGSDTAALLEAANPSSIISFDADDLQALGATDVGDV
ncbi:MAG: hypothetical protein ACX98W_19090, partial [bacterium]